MPKLFPTYRVLALVVGVLLVVGSLGSLCKYLLTDGSTLQELGEQLAFIWLIHGWVYMAYVVVAFLLARAAGWSIRFTLLMLAAGLVPILIFFVEHQVAQRLRNDQVSAHAAT